MNVFWRKEPLTPEEENLIQLVGDAHGRSAYRQNPSTVTLACVAQGTGDLCRAIAAALMTIGGRHGPITDTYELLDHDVDTLSVEVTEILDEDRKVPGWGSSFAKEDIDPLWKEVNGAINKHWPEMADRLNTVTLALHGAGIRIMPNPSAYSAAAAIILKMPKELSPYLLIFGRLASWSEIFLNELKGTN